MNKKIKNLFLAGSLVVGLAGVAVSCTDYDDDINKLQSDLSTANANITSLQSTVASLQSAISAGAVITNVTALTDGNGGYKVTLSDGKTFSLYNGSDGKNGNDGKSPVVTILSNGNWAIDGVDTGKSSVGTAGAAAAQVWYTPSTAEATYGYWVKNTYDPATGKTTSETTSDKWLTDASNISVVVSDDYATFTVKDENGKNKTFSIALNAKLASLVFIPQAYVDGVEAMIAETYEFAPIEITDADSKDEGTKVAGDVFTVTKPLYAEYHVNPSNAVIPADATYEFVLNQEGNTPFYETRAKAQSLAVLPTFESYEDGILTVKVDVEGTVAEDEYISVVALKVADTDTTVVSDYATLYTDEMSDIAIARPNALSNKHKHYATDIEDKWTETVNEAIDTTVDYESTIDLMTIVAGHAPLAPGKGETEKEYSEEELEALGLSWSFALVGNYNNEKDPESNYAALDETTFDPKDDVYGIKTIGHAPIVRAILKHGDDIIKVAYIKIGITGASKIETDVDVTDPSEAKNVFTFNCDAVPTNTVTAADFKAAVLDKLTPAPTMDEFKALYTSTEVECEAGELTVGEDYYPTWTIDPQYAFEHAGETIEGTITYQNAEKTLIAVVNVAAKISDVAKTYDLTSGPNYIQEYWYNEPDKNVTSYNVNVPDVGEEDADKCIFNANINAAFVTKAGKTVLPDGVSNLEFFFCKEMEAIETIGGKAVKFHVSDDGLTLTAEAADAAQTIATIDNKAEDIYNAFSYNKESEVAKALLNTGKMYVLIGAKAQLCANAQMPVAITFNGADHFTANVVRPIDLVETAADYFVDAVDLGEDGSYVTIEDFVAPKDWRGRTFENYENYWSYYGPFSFSVDEESAQCNLNGEWAEIPQTVEFGFIPAEDGKVVLGGQTIETEYGILKYHNNQSHVKDFAIRVKVTVDYGWGTIASQYIEIPVKETISED